MGTVKSLLLGMCFVLGACTSQTSTVQTTEKGTQWEWQNGTIVVKTPERPAGQKVSDGDDLLDKLQYYKSGEKIEAVIARATNGEYEENTIELTLGTRPDNE